MKSIAVVIPFFGKKPSYFDVWKYSALKNPCVDFIFFTDIDEITEEKNIKVYKTTFNDFANLFRSKFDFEISLNAPYKLCDFRPAYAYVLSDYLKDYDFWGHADVDLVFGDVKSFITEDMLNSYDKILEHGHFCLYRNCESINSMFMNGFGYKDYDYKKCLSTPDAMYFDEAIGARSICNRLNVPTYKNDACFFDVLPSVKEFTHINDAFKESIFRYDDSLNKLYAVYKENGEIKEKEIMYAHFQKRKMDYMAFKENTSFYIVPNKLILSSQVESVDSLFNVKGKFIYKLQRKIVHVKEFFARYKKSGVKSFNKFRKMRKAFRYDLANAKKGVESNND
jgi:hypothetical protein